MEREIDHHCGNCIFFKFEDTDGDGNCVKHYWDIDKEGEDPMLTNCSNESCPDFISNDEKLQHFRYLLELKKLCEAQLKLIKECNYEEPLHAREQTDALSFAINYIKAFNKL